MPQASRDRLENKEAIYHFKNKTLVSSFNYREVNAQQHAIAF